MIAVDTNILVYAHRKDSPFHSAAHACISALAESARSWSIPWPCIHEFLNVVTHRRVYVNPTPLQKSIEQIAVWTESENVTCISEAPGYWEHFRDIVTQAKITGPKVHDARIAAICRLHGVRELWSADRDFSLFPDVTVRNPLIG